MKFWVCSLVVGGSVLALLGAWGTRSVAPRADKSVAARVASARAAHPRAAENYGKLPMSFEVNEGQTDGQVKFLARGQGYTLFLTSQGAVLSLQKPEGIGQSAGQLEKPGTTERAKRSDAARVTRATLEMKVVGANAKARVVGAEELPGKNNYFIGNDPKKWRTNIPTYAKVRVEDVYPGIDLVYYGNHEQLEYDFVVRPGADPGTIKLTLTSPSPVKVDAEGNLVAQAEGGEVRFHKPVIYQPTLGERGTGAAEKTLVAGGYKINEQKEVVFTVAAYDKTRPLVIDPTLVYSTYLGGTGFDAATAVAADASGNAYVTGYTGSTDFPTSANALQSTVTGAFLTKLNADGSALIYSTYLGGSNGPNYGHGIAVDSSGNAFLTGATESSDFPTVNAFQASNPSFQPLSNSNANGFVVELNASGSALIYATYLGGSQRDEGRAIAVDSSGYAYVTGTATSSDFPTVNPLQAGLHSALGNAFVTKFSPGGSVVYSTYLGGSSPYYLGDLGQGIAADSLGNAYVAGITGSTDFPTASPFQAHLAGADSNAFVTKLNANGSALVYSTYLGGSQQNWGNAIAVDSSGNAYVTGNTSSIDFPTANAFQPAYRSNTRETNAFVAKLNSSGSALVYSTYLGGSGNSQSFSGDSGNGIAVDQAGNAYVTGYTTSPDFPTADAIQSANNGGPTQFRNAFVTQFDPSGSVLVYSTYLGGSGNPQDFSGDSGNGIAVDQAGNAYIAGFTDSSDFPATANAFQQRRRGSAGTAFVTKISDKADLNIHSLAPTATASGSMITYVIEVMNNGRDTAFNVSIQDAIPAGGTFNSVVFNGGSCTTPSTAGTGTVNCTVPYLASGAVITETLTVNVTAAAGSAIMDTATVSSTTFDPFPGNNSAEITTSVVF